jgi:translation elongation factor EF-Ts
MIPLGTAAAIAKAQSELAFRAQNDKFRAFARDVVYVIENRRLKSPADCKLLATAKELLGLLPPNPQGDELS